MGADSVMVWFRRDLRLADNLALDAAIRSGLPVIPVFIWAPEEEAAWAPGAASRWWLHQSLAALRASLRGRGSDLIIRHGPAGPALLTLATETGAKAIYWNRVYEPAARERELEKELRGRGISTESFRGTLLFDPDQIRNQAGEPFRVFTAFWRACLKAPAPATPKKPPPRIPAPRRWPRSLQLSSLGLQSKIDWMKGMRATWRPGEQGAGERLKHFVRGNVEHYSEERDRPDLSGTSHLSPHLHFGEITARQVWHAARSGAESYLRQIGWREFAYHLLFHYPQTATEPLRPEFARFPWGLNESHLKAWTSGMTGYPLVDAGMRELWATGWMHNRVRMVAGSFLVKHLLIAWQEGAAWFWDTLVDADLANNTLGWQWVAGCGADAAPYFRIFHPVLQGEKFDPQGDYVRQWVPELARLPVEWIHKPWEAPRTVLRDAGVTLGVTYPKPIVEHEAARKRALAALGSIARRKRS